MLVRVNNFGCNWWARFGADPADSYAFTRRAAYYNSTGVRCGKKIRRHWLVPGVVRFNGTGDFNPNFTARSLNRTFLASDLDSLFGGNRLLLKRKVQDSISPDLYLVVVSSDLHGRINFSDTGWKSTETRVIAASQLRREQEAMLLMKPGDWIKTKCGFWRLTLTGTTNFAAQLELESEGSLSR